VLSVTIGLGSDICLRKFLVCSLKYFLPVWQNFPVIANVSWTYNVSDLGDTVDWPKIDAHYLLAFAVALLAFVIAPLQPEPQYDWLSVSFPQSYMECLSKHKTVFSKPYMIPTP
jgi:hypothetical protein